MCIVQRSSRPKYTNQTNPNASTNNRLLNKFRQFQVQFKTWNELKVSDTCKGETRIVGCEKI